MKKIKNFNYLYILAILAILFIIIITIKMKESFSYIKYDYPPNYIPNRSLYNDSTKKYYDVMYKYNTDYPNNDKFTSTNTSYATCLDGCIGDFFCRGIVTDFDQTNNNSKKGTCWRKKKMNENDRRTTSSSTPRYSTLLNKNLA